MAKQKKALLIIGAGPAGIGAALYSRRSDLDFTVIEKHMPGGQIVNTEFIENYLGYEKLSGFELIEKFLSHCKSLGVEFKEYTALSSIEEAEDNGRKCFLCKVMDSSDTYLARSLILATGARPKVLGAEGEKEFIGSGISFCATCDGALYRDKEVAVIGGGDTALEESLFLAKFAKKVYVIHRRDELRAVKILQDRAMGEPKIKFIFDSAVVKFLGKESIEKIAVRNLKSGRTDVMNIDGVFEYVGFEPNSGLVKDLVDLDKNGFILTDNHMRTSCEGIYAAGDVRSTPLRQVITAVSDGAVAASSIDKHLRGLL